jgi:hypothetical protein
MQRKSSEIGSARSFSMIDGERKTVTALFAETSRDQPN